MFAVTITGNSYGPTTYVVDTEEIGKALTTARVAARQPASEIDTVEVRRLNPIAYADTTSYLACSC